MDVAGAKMLRERIERRRAAAGPDAGSALDRPEPASCSGPGRRVLEWLEAVAHRPEDPPAQSLAPDEA
jgi:hypothetical protein